MLKTEAGDIIGTDLLDDQDILYTRREAARYLKKSEPTLERWAAQGIGPRPRKIGPRTIAYTLADLRAFVASAQAA